MRATASVPARAASTAMMPSSSDEAATIEGKKEGLPIEKVRTRSECCASGDTVLLLGFDPY